MSQCQACRREVPTKYVEYYQNIGMLVMRSMRSVRGNLCRRCSKKYFLNLTGLTLVTGWWGMISRIINPFLILNNTIRYCGCLGLPDGGDGAFPVEGAAGQPAAMQPPPALLMHRQDVTLRLKGGQSPDEIAKYLAPRAGISVQVAQQFVDGVRSGQI